MRRLVLLLILLLLPSISKADVPKVLHFTSTLSSAAGAVVLVPVKLRFRIYDEAVGGNTLWEELHDAVVPDAGLVSVLLGSNTEIPATVFSSGSRYLGVSVEDGPELSPRQRLVSVPYALGAATLKGLDSTSCSANQVIRRNAMNTGWVCSVDETSDNDGDPANEVNTSLDWNGATSTLSVTDSGGTKSAAITGFLKSEADTLESVTGREAITSTKVTLGGGADFPGSGVWNLAGSVGIGTTDPQEKLDVTGRIKSSSLAGAANRCVYVDSNGVLHAKTEDCGTASGADHLGNHIATQNIRLMGYWLSGDGDNEGVHVTGAGDVGVGRTDPQSKLHVDGVITAAAGNSTEWSQAFGWGNHAGQGYVTALTEADPQFNASAAKNVTGPLIDSWNQAFGWGNHAEMGYHNSTVSFDEATGALSVTDLGGTRSAVISGFLKGEADTLESVTGRGGATNTTLTLGGGAVFPGTGVWNLAGNVGIGTNDPGYKLHVVGTARISGALTLGGASAFTFPAADGTNGQVLATDGSGTLTWQTIPGDNWGSQAVVVTARLSGLGTPAEPLELARQGASNGQVLKWTGAAWEPAGDDKGLEGSGANHHLAIWNAAGGIESSDLYQADSGNVGIGTTDPQEKLEVVGGIKSTALAGAINRCVYVDSNGVLHAKSEDCGTASGADNLGNHIVTQNIRLMGYWLSGDGDNEGIRVTTVGNVGVGTDDPQSKLHVMGVVTAEGGNSTQWNQAYGWGNHADENYLKSYTETDPQFNGSVAKNITEPMMNNWNLAYGWGNHADENYLKSYTETDPQFNGSAAKDVTELLISSWNQAHGWGNHADENYLKSYTETDPQVGIISTGYLPRWNGTALVTGTVFDNGTNVGIGNSDPGFKLEVTGTARVSGSLTLGGADAFTFPAADGAAGQVLVTDGSGILTWQTIPGDNWGTQSVSGSARFSGNGTSASPLELSQQGASTGQVLKWSGDAWEPAADDAGMSGSGTDNYICRWDGTGGLEASGIYQSDAGNVGIGTTDVAASKLTVAGTIAAEGGASSQWNQAYGWGNHATEGYLKSYSESDPQVGSNSTSYVPRWNGSSLTSGSIYDDGSNVGIGTTNVSSYRLNVGGAVSASGNIYASGGNSTEWNAAYDWGNHASAGYLTSYSESDPQVGSNTTNYVPKWNGSALVKGAIYEYSNAIGIGTTSLGTHTLNVSGTINSSSTIYASGGNSSQWNTAYGWGNHASAGYLSSYTESDPQVGTITNYYVPRWTGSSLNTGTIYDYNSKVSIGTTDPGTHKLYVSGTIASNSTIYASGGNSSNWNTAYSWGDHADEGYLTSYSETDPQVGVISTNYVPRWSGSALVTGSIYDSSTKVGIGTTNTGSHMLKVNGSIEATGGTSTQWNTAYSWGNHASAGYLESGSEEDPQVGSNTTGYVPRWNGSALTSGVIYDNGTNVGIGTNSVASYKLNVNGTIRATSTIYASGGNSGNWNTAYGWGNHSGEGYHNTSVSWDNTSNTLSVIDGNSTKSAIITGFLESESDDLDDVVARGSSTARSVTFTSGTVTTNNLTANGATSTKGITANGTVSASSFTSSGHISTSTLTSSSTLTSNGSMVTKAITASGVVTANSTLNANGTTNTKALNVSGALAADSTLNAKGPANFERGFTTNPSLAYICAAGDNATKFGRLFTSASSIDFAPTLCCEISWISTGYYLRLKSKSTSCVCYYSGRDQRGSYAAGVVSGGAYKYIATIQEDSGNSMFDISGLNTSTSKGGGYIHLHAVKSSQYFMANFSYRCE